LRNYFFQQETFYPKINIFEIVIPKVGNLSIFLEPFSAKFVEISENSS
jgi:hypothetical protein